MKDCQSDKTRMEDERKVLQDSLQKSADEVTAQLAVTTAKNTDLEKIKQVLDLYCKLQEYRCTGNRIGVGVIFKAYSFKGI